MPNIKTSIYDGAIYVAGNGTLDLSTADAKFEIVAIQILGNTGGTSGATLTNLTPVNDYWPGSTLGSTTNETTFGAVNGSEGAAWAALDVSPGVTVEGRWKKVTTSAGDPILCYVKAKTARTI